MIIIKELIRSINSSIVCSINIYLHSIWIKITFPYISSLLDGQTYRCICWFVVFPSLSFLLVWFYQRRRQIDKFVQLYAKCVIFIVRFLSFRLSEELIFSLRSVHLVMSTDFLNVCIETWILYRLTFFLVFRWIHTWQPIESNENDISNSHTTKLRQWRNILNVDFFFLFIDHSMAYVRHR